MEDYDNELPVIICGSVIIVILIVVALIFG